MMTGPHYVNREKGIEPDIAEGVTVNGLIDCIHKITIEKDVFFGYDCMLLTGSHNPNLFVEERRRVNGGGPITIHEGVWMGTRAIIVGPVEVGKHAVIGSGAVVVEDIPEYALVAGNPARVKKIYAH